jgi:hypothetical protein
MESRTRGIAMALAGVQYDIFISYPRENRPWVREFRRRLQEALDQLTPSIEKPRIFFDDNDWGGRIAASLLRQHVTQCCLSLSCYPPTWLLKSSR